MKLGIVLPWRATKTRIAGFEVSLKRHEELFPDVTIYKSDSKDIRFNPSEARNRGCLQAINDGCNVLAVLDADTLFEFDSINAAVKIATTEGIVCYPYTVVTDLTLDETDSFFSGALNPFNGMGDGNSALEHVGSGWVMTAETFKKLNGWDEHFVGWGYEDDAFQCAHQVVLGSYMKRVSGACFRLYHEERDQARIEDNRKRFLSYKEVPEETLKEMLLENLVHQKEVQNED